MNLNNLSMNALVAIRNDLNPDAPVKGFSQKSKAIEAITKLAKTKGISLSKQYDEHGQRVKVAAAPKTKAPKAKAVKEKKEKGPVIRVVAEELLMEVVGKDEDGRNVGRTYASVLEEIHERFPGSNTSVACLRWYAVRMRERGDKVPNRPRAKPEATEE